MVGGMGGRRGQGDGCICRCLTRKGEAGDEPLVGRRSLMHRSSHGPLFQSLIVGERSVYQSHTQLRHLQPLPFLLLPFPPLPLHQRHIPFSSPFPTTKLGFPRPRNDDKCIQDYGKKRRLVYQPKGFYRKSAASRRTEFPLLNVPQRKIPQTPLPLDVIRTL